MPQPKSVLVCVCFGFFFSPLCRQNGKKKLPSFFGIEGGQERDTTTDKILQYIPGKASTNSSNPCSPLLPEIVPTHPKDSTTGLDQGAAAGLSQGDEGHNCSPGRDEPRALHSSRISSSSVPMRVPRGPATNRNLRRGGKVALRAKLAAWWEYHTHPFALGSFVSGQPAKEGKIRASIQR